MSKTPEYIKEDDGFADVTLAKSEKVNGASVSVIRMREPKVRDLEASQSPNITDAEREVKLFANLCMVTADEVRDMSARNYRRLQMAFALFTN
jgi:hypothetical protein